MMRSVLISLVICVGSAGTLTAEALVASHTIRSRTILTAADVALVAEDAPGALTDPSRAIGMEARVVLYAGRPVLPEHLAPAAVIERNQTVSLIYSQGGLAISTDGRSLSRAAAGEQARVMNLQSKTAVTGIVDAEGRVFVNPSETTHFRMENER